jgi:hypothetical protein
MTPTPASLREDAESVLNYFKGHLLVSHENAMVRVCKALLERLDREEAERKKPDPFSQALNEGDGVYRP